MPANTDLGSLTVNDGTDDVANGVTTVTVVATPMRADADVEFSVADADATSEDHQVSLDVGADKIIITVTNEDSVRVYMVTINRAAP